MRSLALSLALLAAACAGSSGAREGPLPGGPVPLRLRLLDGRDLGLAALRGRPVALTVLTTWSDPALVELHLLETLLAEHPDELAVVVVALDPHPEMVRIFATVFSSRLIVATVPDPARFTGPEGPFGPIAVLPTSVLLDREGRILARMDGLWPPGLLRRSVEAAIAGRP